MNFPYIYGMHIIVYLLGLTVIILLYLVMYKWPSDERKADNKYLGKDERDELDKIYDLEFPFEKYFRNDKKAS